MNDLDPLTKRLQEHERRLYAEEQRQRIAAYIRLEVVPKEVGVFHNDDDPPEGKND